MFGTLAYHVQVPYLGAGKAGKVFLGQVSKVIGDDLPDELRDYKMVIKMPIIKKYGALDPRNLVVMMRGAEMDQEARMILKLMVPLDDPYFPVTSGLGRFRMKIEGSPVELNDFMPMELVGSDIGDSAVKKGNVFLYSGPLAYFKSVSESRPEYEKVKRDGKTMMCQLMKGLEYTVSRRVILRDVKPDNVLARVRPDKFMLFDGRYGEQAHVPDPMAVKWNDFGKAVDLDNIRKKPWTGGWMADMFIAAPQRSNEKLNTPEGFIRGRSLFRTYREDPAESPYYSFDMWHASYVLLSIAVGEDQKVTERESDPIETVHSIPSKAVYEWAVRRYKSRDSAKDPLTDTQVAILKFGGMALVDLLGKMAVKEEDGKWRISPVEAIYHPFFYNIPNNPDGSWVEWKSSLAGQYANKLHQLGLELRDSILGVRGYYEYMDGKGKNSYLLTLCSDNGSKAMELTCRDKVKKTVFCDAPGSKPGMKCSYDSECTSGGCTEGKCQECQPLLAWGCQPYGRRGDETCIRGSQCKSNECVKGRCTECVEHQNAGAVMSRPLFDFCMDYHKLMCMSLLPTVSQDRSVPGSPKSWYSTTIPRFSHNPYNPTRTSCAELLKE